MNFKCDECGNTFEASPSRRIHPNTFCSRACAARARERRFGHASASYACEECGNVFHRPVSQAPGAHTFCSRACYMAWRRKVFPRRAG